MEMFNRVLKIVIVTLFMLSASRASNATSEKSPETNNNLWADFMAEMWVDGAQMTRILWLDCSAKAADNMFNDTLTTIDRYQIFTTCLKSKTLKALDRSLSHDVISIGDGVHFIRYQKVSSNGDIIFDNKTDSQMTDNEINEKEWQYLVLQRISKVLNSHVLKVDMWPKSSILSPENQAQRGRRRFQMMQMMIFGIVSLGMIIVPMGFQFLAVLGGKALLIAKFALILSSIQGLKKIATSPLNYGLYQYPQQQFQSPEIGNFEKRAHSENNNNVIDTIKYRYNRVSKSWMAEPMKPTPEPVEKEPSPVFNPYENPTYIPVESQVNLVAQPAETFNEYIIDLPVNKLQLKPLH